MAEQSMSNTEYSDIYERLTNVLHVGQRLKNGWKKSGCPSTYKLSEWKSLK